jgi:hypothetical protein
VYKRQILPNIHLFRDALIQDVANTYTDGIKRTIEIDLSNVSSLNDDLKTQAEALSAMWWITPNEKRDMQQFEELDEPLMNQILIDSGKMLLTDLGVVPDVIIPS